MSAAPGVRSVRSRLLSLIVLIIVPVAAVCTALAFNNYQLMLRNIEASQAQASSDFAVRTRAWFRGVQRTAELALKTMPDPATDIAGCRALAAAALTTSPTYAAVLLADGDGTPCMASRLETASDDAIIAIGRAQNQAPATQRWGAPTIGAFRYDVGTIGKQHFGIVHLRGVDGLPPERHATVLFRIEQLEPLFSLGKLDGTAIVALYKMGESVLLSRGADVADRSWLPDRWPVLDPQSGIWRGVSASGSEGVYTFSKVIEPDVLIVARFGAEAEHAARLQLALLAGAPLLMLVLLAFAYWRYMDRIFVRGIDGIEDAATAEAAGDSSARAPLTKDMPEELLRVAQAFNRMADAAAAREQNLRDTLQANVALMRELHHRVKNSLQVIQSYLALTRRRQPEKGGEILRDAEAKVQVLATAYRYALTDGGLRPVPVKAFARELLSNLTEASRRSSQWIGGIIDTDAVLDVDRAIPLGLAIVEMAFSCLKTTGCDRVHVEISNLSRHEIRLAISMNGDAATIDLSVRTLRGLQLQLGALTEPLQGEEQLRWSIGTVEGMGKL